MIVCTSISQFREERARLLAVSETPGSLGLFPTMGYLHAGHAEMIRIARKENRLVAVSIFVNPLQFGPHEDLERYPRSPEADEQLCRLLDVDLLFMPSIVEMYGQQPVLSSVHVGMLGSHLCGTSRPGHFDGVCTVVAKLFNIVMPTRAYFSRKDAQQLRIVQQMTRDLSFPVEIVAGPIVREEDGLAISSRNAYLTASERAIAPRIAQTLRTIQRRVAQGERDVALLQREAVHTLEAYEGIRVDYLSFVDPDTLQPFTTLVPGRETLCAAAVYVGKTRLIDNIDVRAPASTEYTVTARGKR